MRKLRYRKYKLFSKVTHMVSYGAWFEHRSYGSSLFVQVPRQLSLLLSMFSMFYYLRKSPHRQHDMQTGISHLNFRHASTPSFSFTLDGFPKCSHRTFLQVNQGSVLIPSLSLCSIWHCWPQASPENSHVQTLCSLTSLIVLFMWVLFTH